MRTFVVALALAALSGQVFGQGDKQDPKVVGPGAEGKAAPKPDVNQVQKAKPGPAVGRTRHHVIRGGRATETEKAKTPGVAKGVVSFEASIKPGSLAPGMRGTMVVVMALKGDAVMLDPPPVTFDISNLQGPLTVMGPPRFRPPLEAGLAPALKGLPVYDDLAILEVPFAVADDADPGNHPLAFALQYQLINGTKGGMVGSFTDVVSAEVVVHKHLAAVAAESQLARARGDAQPAVPTTREPSAADPERAALLGGTALGGDVPPAVSGVAATADTTSVPQAQPSTLLWAAIGIGGVLFVLLLVGRNRQPSISA